MALVTVKKKSRARIQTVHIHAALPIAQLLRNARRDGRCSFAISPPYTIRAYSGQAGEATPLSTSAAISTKRTSGATP